MEGQKVEPKQACTVDSTIPTASRHFNHQESCLTKHALAETFEGARFDRADDLQERFLPGIRVFGIKSSPSSLSNL